MGDVERLDGADAEAREWSFVEDATQEFDNAGAGRKVTPPGAEIDTAENNLLEAGVAEATDFGKDRVGRKAAAVAPNEWNDAEGAAVVAAVLNFESGASVIPFSTEDGGNEDVAGGKDVSGNDLWELQALLWFESQGRRRGRQLREIEGNEALVGFRDEVGNLGFVGIADDERDTGEGRKFFGGALGVTTGDKDFGGRILRVDFANGIAGLCVGGGSDGAGVDDDELGVLRRSRGGAAAIKELAFDGGAVGLSGATAELFDVEGRHGGKKKSNTESTESTETLQWAYIEQIPPPRSDDTLVL